MEKRKREIIQDKLMDGMSDNYNKKAKTMGKGMCNGRVVEM